MPAYMNAQLSGTILSSLFPVIKILTNNGSEVRSMPADHRPNDTPTEHGIEVKDYLPIYNCDGLDVEIQFHLLVVENDPKDFLWKTQKKLFPGLDAINVVPIQWCGPDGEWKKLVPEKGTVVTMHNLKYFHPECIALRFVSRINLDDFTKIHSLEDLARGGEDYLCECDKAEHYRTMLMTLELIGVYRHTVNKLSWFLGQKGWGGVPGGAVLPDGLHPHNEDVYRLVCHFQYFAKVESSVVKKHIDSIRALGLKAYDQLLRDKDAYKMVTEDLRSEWRVPLNVIKAKLLEYSIYQQIENTQR